MEASSSFSEKRFSVPLQQMLLAIKNTNKCYLLEQFAFESASIDSKSMSCKLDNAQGKSTKSTWNFKELEANIVDIATLVSSVDTVLFDKMFLGRIIVEPFVLEAIVFLAEDPQGERAVRIEVQFDSEVTNSIRKGSIVALRNPCYKIIRGNTFGLLYTSAKDIAFFEAALFRSSFRSIKWKNTEHTKASEDKLPIDNTKELEERVSAIRQSGNQLFTQGKFSKAIEKYSEGLSVSPRNEDLLSNRSLSYLKMSNFQDALDDALLVLKINPRHVKAIHRAAQAYNGLQKFENAQKLLEDKLQMELSSYTRELREILAKTKRWINQRDHGLYDMVELFGSYQKPIEHDIVNFVGPVKVEDVGSKGRGLIVTENVDAGQLIMCVKAVIFNSNPIENPEIDLIKKIEENLKGNADLLRDLKELEMCPKLRRKGNKNKASMSLSRIKAIASEFSASFPLKSGGNICGLWIPACYMNNACYETNCCLVVLGSVCQVRTSKALARGTELLIPYLDHGCSYMERKALLNVKGFTCECSLCKQEPRESPELRIEMERVFFMLRHSPVTQEEIEHVIKQIRKVSGKSHFIHYYLLLPLNLLSKFALNNGNFDKAIEAATEILQNRENAGGHIGKILHEASLVLFTVYSLRNDEQNVMKFKKIFKRHVELLLGSSEDELLELLIFFNKGK